VKLADVKPLVDKLVRETIEASAPVLRGGQGLAEQELRLALESAFVAGVRSGLKFTSNAKFAEVFGGKRSDK
jgi:hypothetical protein